MDNRIHASNAVHLEPLRKQLAFSLTIPGSKSLANRALLLAGVAQGESCLEQIPDSDDIQAALGALDSLGIAVTSSSPTTYRIAGSGLRFANRQGDVPIRSSGTVGRFLTGLLAAASSGSWRLVASDQLSRRPIGPLLDALTAWGAAVSQEHADRSFPLLVRGSGLSGGDITVSAAASSQFASGILMAAPLATHASRIEITDLDPEECYIDLTLELMRQFGVHTKSEKTPGRQCVMIEPQPYRACSLTIEADFNSALYFLALPLLTGGSVTIDNLSSESGQPGRKFLAVLRRLGGDIRDEQGKITASGTGLPLHGDFTIDMRAMSEMALTLGILAVFADGPITMTNLAHIRGHETDRLHALACQLAAVGVKTEEGRDWIRVHPHPTASLPDTTIDSCDDHRIAMSFALLGLAGNGITIRNPGAVAKTFPDFFDRLSAAGAQITL